MLCIYKLSRQELLLAMLLRCGVSALGGGTTWGNVSAEVWTSCERDADQPAWDEHDGESRPD